MDLYILVNAIVSFILFLIVHVVIFRSINEKTVIKWLMRVCYLGVFINLFTGYFILRPYNAVFAFLSLILYTLLVYCYILGIFGLMESSIRIGLLAKIAEAKSCGIRKRDILEVYNKKIIIDKRLSRFIASGELKYEKGYYHLNKKFSYFIINDFINSIMRKIYAR